LNSITALPPLGTASLESPCSPHDTAVPPGV